MPTVVDAGTSAASGPETKAGRSPQLDIRKIDGADVIECIEKGVRDFARAPLYGMFFGGVYALGGLLIFWSAFSLGYYYLAYPMVMGFALLAPFAAAGTYEISRRLEAGEPLSWSAVLGAVWNRAGKELGWLALVSLFTFLIWLDVAVFLFLMFYGMDVPTFEQMFTPDFHHDLRPDVPYCRQQHRGDRRARRLFLYRRLAPAPHRPRRRLRHRNDDERPGGHRQSARHAGLGDRDRRRPRNFVRNPVRRPPRHLPNSRPYDLAPVPQADCLSRSGGVLPCGAARRTALRPRRTCAHRARRRIIRESPSPGVGSYGLDQSLAYERAAAARRRPLERPDLAVRRGGAHLRDGVDRRGDPPNRIGSFHHAMEAGDRGHPPPQRR